MENLIQIKRGNLDFDTENPTSFHLNPGEFGLKLPNTTIEGEFQDAELYLGVSPDAETEGGYSTQVKRIMLVPPEHEVLSMAQGGTGDNLDGLEDHSLLTILNNKAKEIKIGDGALYSNGEEEAQFGTLPIEQGGTGVTTVDDLKTLLGLIGSDAGSINQRLTDAETTLETIGNNKVDKSVIISSSAGQQDFNKFVTSGFYRCEGSNFINGYAGSGSYYGQLLVNRGSVTCVQMYTPTGANVTNPTYVRECQYPGDASKENWGPWERFSYYHKEFQFQLNNSASSASLTEPQTKTAYTFSGWKTNSNNYTCTVTVNASLGITANSDLIVTPEPSSTVAWNNVGIYASAQSANVLTFTAVKNPMDTTLGATTVKANVLMLR